MCESDDGDVFIFIGQLSVPRLDARILTWSILTLASAAACDRPPTAPGPRSVWRVELIAPATLAPGATVQLRLISHLSDGSTEDITTAANFVAGSPEVIDVTRSGLATGLAHGEGHVSGNYGTLSSSREVVVVPDGTYRVIGQVIEESTAIAVGGAQVDSVGEPRTAVLTDLTGYYRLYGAAGNGRLRISKQGYVTKELDLSITDHHTENVSLALAGPRVDVAGLYQMTFDAAAQCRGRIPDALLTRRYAAAVAQSGADARVVLSGARFRGFDGPPTSSTVVPGQVDRGNLSLLLAWPTHCERTEPDSRVMEVIDDGTYLEISGAGTLVPTGEGFAGVFQGMVIVRPSFQCGAPTTSGCFPASYRVTLTR